MSIHHTHDVHNSYERIPRERIPALLRRQVTLIGSWTFSAMGMLECARFIAENRIDLERIFSHRWRLEQADEAYRAFDSQTTGKGVFLF